MEIFAFFAIRIGNAATTTTTHATVSASATDALSSCIAGCECGREIKADRANNNQLDIYKSTNKAINCFNFRQRGLFLREGDPKIYDFSIGVI